MKRSGILKDRKNRAGAKKYEKPEIRFGNRPARSYEKPVLSLSAFPGLTGEEKKYLSRLDELYAEDVRYAAAEMHFVEFSGDTYIGIPTGPEGNSRILEFNETGYYLISCYRVPRTMEEVYRMALEHYGGPEQTIREDVAVFTAAHRYIGLLKTA